LSLQKKGKKIVEFVRAGKQYTRYQIIEAPKIADASTEWSEFNITLTKWYESGSNINSYLGSAFDGLTKSSEYVDTALYGVSTATSSGSADIESSVTDITLAQTENEEESILLFDFIIQTLNKYGMLFQEQPQGYSNVEMKSVS